jgi:hypothetical protein
MGMISYFSARTLAEFLRRSNYWAKQNRNRYPVRIYKTLSDLYEWIDCPCGPDCECRKHGCRKHLVRKDDVSFEDCYSGFLQCYVDSRLHTEVRAGKTTGRAYRAVEATEKVRSNWAGISRVSIKTHLLCSHWCDPLYEGMARGFKASESTIYLAKWMSILCFDTFTAYDTASVALFNRDFGRPPTFYDLMREIRQDILTHLQKTGSTVQGFRSCDDPSEFFDEIPKGAARPLGNVIDKLYLTL